MQLQNLPKLEEKDSKKLFNRLSLLAVNMDVYEMLIQNAGSLNQSSGQFFLGYLQQLLRQDIYVGFYAIISSDILKIFKKSLNKDHPKSIVLSEKLDTMKENYKYLRDKHYAHIDSVFDHQQAPAITLISIKQDFDLLLYLINSISLVKTIFFPKAASISVCQSLQTIIDHLTKQKDIGREENE